MQFEMNHKVGTDYSTVIFKPHAVKGFALLAIIESFQKLGGEMVDTVSNWKFPKHITSQVLQEVIHNTCYVCGGLMQDGVAIQEGKVYVPSYDSVMETYQGEIEYPNPNDSKVIKVRKCSACGHSYT